MTKAAVKKTGISLVLTVILGLGLGCAAVPYVPGKDIEEPATSKLEPDEPQIERGRPHAFLDGLGHYVLSLPSKLILWNWHVDNHNISPETEMKLRQFLIENDLRNVKVRLNQCSPGDEWHRLFHNRTIAPGWRYTIGVLSVAFYTAFPGRAFGGDNYNPFTNTLNLYSDHKGIALHEAGHAKDFAQRESKGWYAFLYVLPFVPLYHEAIATGDAVGYDRFKRLPDDERADYKILYPAYGTYVGGEAVFWAPPWVRFVVSAIAAIPGHIVGRIKAAHVEDVKPVPIPARPDKKYVLNWELKDEYSEPFGGPENYIFLVNGARIGDFDALKVQIKNLARGSRLECWGSCKGDPFWRNDHMDAFKTFCVEHGIELVIHPSG